MGIKAFVDFSKWGLPFAYDRIVIVKENEDEVTLHVITILFIHVGIG